MARKYIDDLPFNPDPKIDLHFSQDNLKLIVGVDKGYNLEFLDNLYIAHEIYNRRNKLDPKIRVPLIALVKYKGFKILVQAITPVDSMPQKIKYEKILHGNCEETWKNHFFLVDDLNVLL